MRETTPDAPVAFGYKMCWAALRSEDGLAIASALGFASPEPASWAHGVEAAYAGSVFITPPMEGGRWSRAMSLRRESGTRTADGATT